MLQDTLKDDLKKAQLSRDEIKTSVLRMLLSELKYAEIAKAQALSDEEVSSLIQKEVKKRRESIESFTKGNRSDLAAKEQTELEILSVYLPKQLTSEELTSLIEQTITKLRSENILPEGELTPADTGKIISAVLKEANGQTDGASVSQKVKDIITN